MLNHEAGERDGKVVPQSLFADLGSKRPGHIHFGKRVSRIQYPVQQLVTLVAVFSEKGGKILHRWSFNLRITIRAENRAYGIEYLISPSSFLRTEVAGAFWDGRSLCHSNLIYGANLLLLTKFNF